MAGFVYVLTNPTFPGLVKIGSTFLTPAERAKQLSGTGTPTPYEVAGFVEVPDPRDVELLVHDALADARYTRGREFFCLPVEEALRTLERVALGLPLSEPPAGAPEPGSRMIRALIVYAVAATGVLFVPNITLQIMGRPPEAIAATALLSLGVVGAVSWVVAGVTLYVQLGPVKDNRRTNNV